MILLLLISLSCYNFEVSGYNLEAKKIFEYLNGKCFEIYEIHKILKKLYEIGIVENFYISDVIRVKLKDKIYKVEGNLSEFVEDRNFTEKITLSIMKKAENEGFYVKIKEIKYKDGILYVSGEKRKRIIKNVEIEFDISGGDDKIDGYENENITEKIKKNKDIMEKIKKIKDRKGEVFFEDKIRKSILDIIPAKFSIYFDDLSGMLKVKIFEIYDFKVNIDSEKYISLKDVEKIFFETFKTFGYFSRELISSFEEKIKILGFKDGYVRFSESGVGIKSVVISAFLGVRYYINDVKFYGLSNLSEDEILDKFERKGFLTLFEPKIGAYSQYAVKKSLSDIINYARRKGFIYFSVRDIKEDFEGDNVNISIYVDEGPQVKISKYSIYAKDEIKEKILDNITLPLTFFSSDYIQKKKEEIENFLSMYYVNPKVYIYVDFLDKDIVDVNIFVDVDEKIDVEKIFIISKTDEKFILREIGIGKNNISDGKKLLDIGYFDNVDIKAVGRYVFIRASDKEYLGNYKISLGASSSEGIRGRAKVEYKNFFFKAVDLSSEISASYWFFGMGLSPGLTNFNFSNSILKRKIFPKVDSSFSISYPNVIRNFVFGVNKAVFELSFQYKFRTMISFERRDITYWKGLPNEPNPEEGSINNVLSLSFSYPMQIKNFKSLFSFGILHNNISFPPIPFLDLSIAEKILFYEFSFSFGKIFSSPYRVPIERRFFLGGVLGPRGYEEMFLGSRRGEECPQQICPTKSLGGMNKVLLKNNFYIFERKISPYLFFDVGSVFDEIKSFTNLRNGAGVGIRILSPLGVLRLELGFKIPRYPGESLYVVHFTFD